LRPNDWRPRKGKDGREIVAVEILILSVEFILWNIEIANEKVIDDCMMAANAKEVCNVAALEFESYFDACNVAANAKEVCMLTSLLSENVKGACKVATLMKNCKRFA